MTRTCSLFLVVAGCALQVAALKGGAVVAGGLGRLDHRVKRPRPAFGRAATYTLQHGPAFRRTGTSSTALSADLSSWRVLSSLSVVSTFGVWMERTQIGAMLSSPLITMVTAMLLCNLSLLPKAHPIYDVVLKWLVPVAIPLLLLDADLKKCIKTTGSLLKAFLVGSLGTVAGTLAAYALVPMRNLVGGEKIAAALCARHIGGAVNFVAVSDILQISPELVAASMAADNVVVAIYFAYLFLISVPERNDEEPVAPSGLGRALPTPPPKEECPIPFFRSSSGPESPVSADAAAASTTSAVTAPLPSPTPPRSMQARDGVGLLRMMAALSVGLVLYTLSQEVGRMLNMSPMLLVSLLAVVAATLFPGSMGRVSRAGGLLGVMFMQFFFAVTGGMGHIPTVLAYGPSLFMHTTIQIIVHFLVSVSLGKFLRLPFREIVLASNANVGGPTTAAAMATSKRWKLLILPALLTGVFGYAIATGVGVGIHALLKYLSPLR